MNDVNYKTLFCFKLCVMGQGGAGKTSIINRIVNNSFPFKYEPTLSIERYTTLFNLSDAEIKQKTYVMLTLEDTFGLDNPLLQTPESLITSQFLREKRHKMADVFKDIMFSSNERRAKLSKDNKKSKKDNQMSKNQVYEGILYNDINIERRGFMFVHDVNDKESLEDIISMIDKLHQIEKGNNLFYHKCIMLNKIDRCTDKKSLKETLQILENVKQKYKVDTYKVSAFTNTGVVENFKKFASKIQQQEIENKQNEGLDDMEQDDQRADEVFLYLFYFYFRFSAVIE